jgi:purine-binding chemotaxis protein CheW
MSDLHVRVRVADEDYALSVADVLEVAELGDLTPVPGAGAAVVGVRNLRGQVVPVVDLATVLGLPTASSPERIVITEQGGRKAGLAVDEVAGVEELPESSEEAESVHLTRATLVDGALVGVVDVGSILDAAEVAPARDRA